MENARDARRRKLVARGTDRLAFITGQARDLPKTDDSVPDPNVPSFPDDAAHSVSPKLHEIGQIASGTVENDETSREHLKYETSNEVSKSEMKNNDSPKFNTDSGRSTELPTPSSDQVGAATPSTAPKMNANIFTASEISTSISASEDIRLVCSIIIALLAILSYHGYLPGGRVLGSIMYRPLLLLLVTDATIIFGRILVSQGSKHTSKKEANKTSREWGMAKALEVAMVFQKAVAAVFMDCSICAVIMISGILF